MRNFEPLDIDKGEHISALKILVEELRTKFDTKLIIKDDSRLMRCIGRVFSFLGFNKNFQTQFITTIFGDVYFPSTYRKVVDSINDDDWESLKDPELTPWVQSLLSTLFHEYVHINDSEKSFLRGVGFSVAYLTPQIYAVLGLIALPFSFYNPWFLIPSAIWLAMAAPWTAFWRCVSEARGYATNVVCLHMVYGMRADQINEFAFMSYFNNSSYYWMVGHPLLTPKVARRRVQEVVRQYLQSAKTSLSNKEAGLHLLDNVEHVYRICSEVKAETERGVS